MFDAHCRYPAFQSPKRQALASITCLVLTITLEFAGCLKNFKNTTDNSTCALQLAKYKKKNKEKKVLDTHTALCTKHCVRSKQRGKKKNPAFTSHFFWCIGQWLLHKQHNVATAEVAEMAVVHGWCATICSKRVGLWWWWWRQQGCCYQHGGETKRNVGVQWSSGGMSRVTAEDLSAAGTAAAAAAAVVGRGFLASGVPPRAPAAVCSTNGTPTP